MPREGVVALCECGTLLFGRDRWELEAAAYRCFAEHPEEPIDSPQGRGLRQCLAHVLMQLALVSQADAGSYGFAPADPSSDGDQREVGGTSHPHELSRQFAQARAAWPQAGTASRRSAPSSRPPSGGVDRQREHDRFWRLRSVDYFVDRLNKAKSVRDLTFLVEEAEESLEAWQGRDVIRVALGDEPDRDDSKWKFWVAFNVDSSEEIARKSPNGVTAEEVLEIRRAYVPFPWRWHPRPLDRDSNDVESLHAPPLIGVRRGEQPDPWDDDVEYRREADLRPSPRPLVEVKPRRPGRVPRHPYADLPEHKAQFDQQLTSSMSGRPGRREHVGPVRHSTKDDRAILEWAFELGEDADPRLDAHYGIYETGRTGAPVGRQRHGTTNRREAAPLILDRCAGRTIKELCACATGGRPHAQARPVRQELAVAVSEIREARLATREAMAEALECSVRRIDRLRKAGDLLRAERAADGLVLVA
jgi:hypothetical protein